MATNITSTQLDFENIKSALKTFFKEKSELLVLSRKELDAVAFNGYNELDRVDYEKPKSYNASIWSDYNVIEPLNEMKTFKIESEEE